MKLATGTAAVVLGLLAVAAGVATAAEESAAPAAMLQVEQATIDLGDVVAGSEVVAVFRFQNHSDAAVHIIRAKPS